MPSKSKAAKKRRRQKSSPHVSPEVKTFPPLFKKHRKQSISELDINSDSEGSVFFEAQEPIEPFNGESDNNITITALGSPNPVLNNSTSSPANFADLDDLSSQLAPKLAPLLIKEIIAALRDDVVHELRKDVASIVQAELQPVRKEMLALRLENAKLKSTLDETVSELRNTKLELDELGQYGRRMCLDVSGIPGDTGVADEDIESKVLKKCKEVGVGITSVDIDKIHRKGKPVDNYNRRTIIKFTNSKARQTLYVNRKKFPHGIFIQENLTPLRERLSFEARQLKRSKQIEKTWVSGCRVYVHIKDETNPRLIRTTEDIELIKSQYPMETMEENSA